MSNPFFLHQVKHNKTTGNWEKGIVVKDADSGNYEAALQGYHAYLGAYAYGHDVNTDYVFCAITDENGSRRMFETWNRMNVPEPEPEQDGGDDE